MVTADEMDMAKEVGARGINGECWIVDVYDMATQYGELVPTKDKTTDSIVKALNQFAANMLMPGELKQQI